MSYIILGGGAVVAEFYLPALYLLGALDRTTVVDPSTTSLEALRRKFPTARYESQDYGSFLAGLAATGTERIIITLPNALHVDATRKALLANRHVLCEKPLSLRASECAELAALAQQRGCKLHIAMSRRYLASMMLARQIVASQELGAVLSIDVQDCSEFLWRPQSFAFFAPESGGVLADMGVHYLDFLDSMLGPLQPIAYSDDACGGTESSAAYQLQAGATRIALKLSRINTGTTAIRIACEHGDVIVAKGVENAVTVMPQGRQARTLTMPQPFDQAAWPTGFHGSFCQMLSDFEREIAGAATPLPDAIDAQRASSLIEWAYTHRVPQAPVTLTERPTVLVTGATGFIGGHLVQRLAATGACNIRVSVRSPATCANLSRFPVAMVPTNLLDPASVARCVEGVKTVFHLAYGKEANAASITIEGTRHVVEAAIAAGAECVVVLSTMYVFGFPAGDRPIDETFANQPYGGEYGNTKATMEQWCLERAKSSGKTRIVVLNPTCVFGPSGGAYTRLPVDLARNGKFCWIEGGSGSCNYVYVENLVDAIELAAQTPAAHGERFIITDGVTTWRKFFEPLINITGAKVPDYTLRELAALPRFGGPFKLRDLCAAVISSPQVRVVAKRNPSVRRLFAWLDARARRNSQQEHLFTYHPEVAMPPQTFPPEWLGELYSPAQAVFTSTKAQRVLGWRSKRTLDQAQQETIGWLEQN